MKIDPKKEHKENQFLGKEFNYPSYDQEGFLDTTQFKNYSDIMVFLTGGEVHVGFVYASAPSKYVSLHYHKGFFSIELTADNLIGWINLYEKETEVF